MRGPAPNKEMIEAVKSYRKKGLSFRQISRVLNKDVKSVYRWAQYETVG